MILVEQPIQRGHDLILESQTGRNQGGGGDIGGTAEIEGGVS